MSNREQFWVSVALLIVHGWLLVGLWVISPMEGVVGWLLVTVCAGCGMTGMVGVMNAIWRWRGGGP